MTEVIPAILEQEYTKIVEKIRMVEEVSPWIQIDILNGTLFGNTCFHNPEPFAALRTVSRLELHMMVVNPEFEVDKWVKAGFKRLIAHIEGITNTEGFIAKVRSHKIEVGLAIDIDTDVSIIAPYLPNIDTALLMAIRTGKSGQEFDDRVVAKIQKVKNMAPDLPISVDGGINFDTAKKVVLAGAKRIASSSYIFKDPHPLVVIKNLQKL